MSTVPSTPRELSLQPDPMSATQLSATWAPPVPANGVITNYTLYCSRSDQQFYPEQVMPKSFTLDISGDDLSVTVMDLDPFTNYDCSISASTSAGEGDRSSEVRQRTSESGELCIGTLTTSGHT